MGRGMPRSRPSPIGLLVLVVGLTACLGAAKAEPAAALTEAEVGRILAHGPWPPPPPRDPSNRLVGMPAAHKFGLQLFFDTGLSRFGALSCASCHKPQLHWTDGRMRASAAAGLDRNTPTLQDVAFNTRFGWDGAADSLWAQSIRPIIDKREMAARPADVKARITGDPALAEAYEQTIGAPAAGHTDELVLVNLAKALAAFQSVLISRRTPFDYFRDRLSSGCCKGDNLALSPAALSGLRLFIGEAGCSRCHAGPRFTDDSFQAALLIGPGPGGRIDLGRSDGLAKLEASPYRRHGAYSDTPAVGRAAAPIAATSKAEGAFRVPSLRGVALTAPYMHDGSRSTLADAIGHGARPLAAHEVADLVAFLDALTPQSAAVKP